MHNDCPQARRLLLVALAIVLTVSWSQPASTGRPPATEVGDPSLPTASATLPAITGGATTFPSPVSPSAADALPLPIRGVDRSGTEYACIQGWGYGDGPYTLASVQAIRSWNVTAVRVPLNEDCWLDINVNGTSAAAWSGAGYRAFVVAYVDLLESRGIRPILDLHWNAPGTNQSVGQEPMADESHAPGFWASVAYTFRNDSLVIFDLYNEPYGISWDCWLSGCFQTYTSPGWQTAGMQQLVDVVRAAGADSQLVILGGLNWSNDDSGWLSHEPVDPAGPGLLGASLHMYQFNSCASWSCWNTTLLPIVHAGIPLITGEMGEADCEAEFLYAYWAWADPLSVSYLGWTWDTWATCTGPVLVSNYNGAPYDTYGTAFRDHLQNFSIPKATRPGVPNGVAASAGVAEVNVTWAPPASSGTWPVENYEVAYGTSTSSLDLNLTTGAGNLTSLTVPGLQNGQAYFFSVRAWSPIGWGPWSANVSATPHLSLECTGSVTPSTGDAPLTVAYSATALDGSGSGYTFLWNFSVGPQSTQEYGTTTFTGAGSYVVTLSCSDSLGDLVSSIAGVVVVAAAPPTLVAFGNATPAQGDAPLSIAFSGDAHGGVAPYTYAWVFGDGGSASEQDPSHTYRAAGDYVARFWVNDSDGHSASPTAAGMLVQVAAPLSVGLSANPSSGALPLTVSFETTVVGGTPPFAYLWDFGTGWLAGDATETHTFNSTGTIDVSVAVRDASGANVSASAAVTVVASLAPCAHCVSAPSVSPLVLAAGLGTIGAAAVAAVLSFYFIRRRKRKEAMARGEDHRLAAPPSTSPPAEPPPSAPPEGGT
jgi:endoglucanase